MAEASANPCPACGELNDRDATQCVSCGSGLPEPEREAVRTLVDSLHVDAETARKLYDSGYRTAGDLGGAAVADVLKDADEGSVLYLCPSCRAFVHGADTECGSCGASLLGEETGEDATAQEDRPCPRCGTVVHVSAEVCPSCGGVVAPPLGPKAGVVCPACETTIPLGRSACDVCGTEVQVEEPAEGVPPPAPSLAEAEAELDQFLELDEPEVPPPPEPEVPPPPPPPPPPVVKPPWQPKSTRPPSAETPTPPRREEPSSRLAPLREFAAIASGLALPAGAAASYLNVPGHEWGQLLLFGVLFGIGTALTAPDIRTLERRATLLLLYAVATALLLAIPLAGYAGVTPASPVNVAMPIAGAAVLAVIGWRIRRAVGPYLPWMSGLLLLTVLAVSPLAFLNPGEPLTVTVLWATGEALTLATASLLLYRRWLRYAADARLLRADERYARREYRKSLEQYDAAIALSRRAGRENDAGWYGKGAALIAMGRNEEAVRCLDHALSLNPGNEVAWVNKGNALSRLGRLTDALRCYNSAIKVNPIYEVAWNNKGNALSRLGRHDPALECYDRAVEIDAAYRSAWVNKGFVLAKLGRYADAASCADTALRLTTGPLPVA